MRWYNYIQLLLVTWFTVSAVAVHFFNTELHWALHFLSGFVHGPGGVFLTIGIYGLVLVQFLVAFEHRDQPLFALMMFLAGVGAFLIALVPINLTDLWSPTSSVHMIGAMLQFGFFPAALLFFKHKKTPEHNFTRYTGYTTLFFFIVISILYPYDVPIGLIQKLDIFFIMLWFYVSILKPGGDLYA